MNKRNMAFKLETMIREPHGTWDRKLSKGEIARMLNVPEGAIHSFSLYSASRFREFYAEHLGGKPLVKRAELSCIFAREFGVPYHAQFGEPVLFDCPHLHCGKAVYTDAAVREWLARSSGNPALPRYRRYIDFVRYGGSLVESRNENGRWVIDYIPCKKVS